MFPAKPRTVTRSLWSLFDQNARSRERGILVLGLGVSVFTIIIAILGALLFPGRGGPYCILVCVASTAWFSFRLLLANSRADPMLRIAGHLFIISLPAAFILVMSTHSGPEIAFSSWIPAQLWLVVITLSLLRMRVWLPTALGVSAAAVYLVCSWVAHDPAIFLTSAPVQMLRASTLVAWGLVASLATWILRRMITASTRSLREQDLFGKYRLGPQIAKGGMGTVNRAVYCPEGGFFRDVAVKRIHPHLANDEESVERFRAEAELGARLHHQNIVATLDFGRASGTYFLAMEFVDGVNLRALLKARGPLDPRVVAHLGREVCRGLRFAHELATDARGEPLRVVHRDLCPNNILVTRTGQVKIADFGIAHALGDQEGIAFSGKVLGKPAYLSPEQVRSEPHDARSDLFALGSVLFELLTGEKAFGRANQAATLFAVASAERPDLARLRPDVHLAWVRFFDRALQRKPARRFGSAAEMSSALAALESEAVAPEVMQRLVTRTRRAPKPAPDDETPPTPLNLNTDEIYDLPTQPSSPAIGGPSGRISDVAA